MSHEVLFQGLQGAVPRNLMKFQSQIQRPSRIRLESRCISFLVTAHPLFSFIFVLNKNKRERKSGNQGEVLDRKLWFTFFSLLKKIQETEIPMNR